MAVITYKNVNAPNFAAANSLINAGTTNAGNAFDISGAIARFRQDQASRLNNINTGLKNIAAQQGIDENQFKLDHQQQVFDTNQDISDAALRKNQLLNDQNQFIVDHQKDDKARQVAASEAVARNAELQRQNLAQQLKTRQFKLDNLVKNKEQTDSVSKQVNDRISKIAGLRADNAGIIKEIQDSNEFGKAIDFSNGVPRPTQLDPNTFKGQRPEVIAAAREALKGTFDKFAAVAKGKGFKKIADNKELSKAFGLSLRDQGFSQQVIDSGVAQFDKGLASLNKTLTPKQKARQAANIEQINTLTTNKITDLKNQLGAFKKDHPFSPQISPAQESKEKAGVLAYINKVFPANNYIGASFKDNEGGDSLRSTVNDAFAGIRLKDGRIVHPTARQVKAALLASQEVDPDPTNTSDNTVSLDVFHEVLQNLVSDPTDDLNRVSVQDEENKTKEAIRKILAGSKVAKDKSNAEFQRLLQTLSQALYHGQ